MSSNFHDLSQHGDPDSVYIVLNGRLRAVQKEQETGKKTLGDEYGRGEFVGLVSICIKIVWIYVKVSYVLLEISNRECP